MKGKVMKVYKRSLVAILLALTMIFGSFSFAFGASGTQLGSMSKVTALPGYDSILVKWNKVSNAQKYEVVIKDSKGRQVKTITDKTYYKHGDHKKNGLEPKVTYTYYVRAIRDDSGKRSYSNVQSASTQIVRQMYETIYLKSSYRLESHGGGSAVTRTFSSSKPLLATGFGGGKFKFWDGSGSNRRLFYVHVSKVRKARGDYFGKTNYSMAAAENFVNDLGIKKSKKSDYLIWVSTNTQHIYFFRYNWDKRKWQIPKIKVNGKYVNGHWEVSTGAPDTPTMINMNLKIQFKERSYSGISWWNCFSGYNAIHGKRQSYVIDGHPHSHGCVRNYNNLAEWIYKNCPVGTPVVIF